MVYTRTFVARVAVAVSEKIEGMKMHTRNMVVAVPAGLIATAVMTVVMLMAPLAGIPAINMPRVLGWSIGVPLSVGMALNFVLGIALALLFAVFFTRRLPAPDWMHGALFGIALWIFLMVIGGPSIGWGFFASRTASPLGTVLTTFLGYVAFGWTLGFTFEKIVRGSSMSRRSVTSKERAKEDPGAERVEERTSI